MNNEEELNKFMPTYGPNANENSSTYGLNTTAPVSPYLHYDPNIVQYAQPEFIFPEGASKQRGRFEFAFSQIGTSVILGGTMGGFNGFYNGVNAIKTEKLPGKLWWTHMLNHVMKHGSGTANSFGILAVMYSAFGVLLQFVRGEDDDINTIAAGTMTGLLYKSTAGLRKCAIGGGVGFGITSLYYLYNYSRLKMSSPFKFRARIN